ncbi:hypothetical protein K7X08_027794 [Anisodus acutangulus]|uniref:Uncharacterized protein n=1 Tax=Anisodus acutangulus TaxID=402998 RepID=A0A9Q1LNG9_9SOLA|nr:hypothetical protein K7X08_027794 [Anisodus acutangulus]
MWSYLRIKFHGVQIIPEGGSFRAQLMRLELDVITSIGTNQGIPGKQIVIFGLLKRVKALEEEKARAKRTWKMLVFGLVFVFAIWFQFVY